MTSPAKSATQRATFKWLDTINSNFFPRDNFAALFWRTPLLRSSSASAPNNYGPPPKAPLFPKTGAMKAVHQQQQQVPPPPAPMKIPPKQSVNAPAPPRRYVLIRLWNITTLLIVPNKIYFSSSLVPSAPAPSLTFQSKLRAPLSRSESDALHQLPTNKAPEFQRQGSVRLGTKRVSISHPPSSVPGSSSSSSHSNRLAPLTRTKAKGRENVESWLYNR